VSLVRQDQHQRGGPMRRLAIGALGARHRARAALPTLQGYNRRSTIRKLECQPPAYKVPPSCGVLAPSRA
jgi:hypothetical protein